MKRKRKNTKLLFWRYVVLFSNLDVELQMEHKLLSYRKFRRLKDKEALIDLYQGMLYNDKKS